MKTPDGNCPYCDYPDEHPCCSSPMLGGYGCTRPRGHNGPHVACSTDGHNLVTSPNPQNEETVRIRLRGCWYETDPETARILWGIVPRAVETDDYTAAWAILDLGLAAGRIRETTEEAAS